jgi:hypothetical protein
VCFAWFCFLLIFFLIFLYKTRKAKPVFRRYNARSRSAPLGAARNWYLFTYFLYCHEQPVTARVGARAGASGLFAVARDHVKKEKKRKTQRLRVLVN